MNQKIVIDFSTFQQNRNSKLHNKTQGFKTQQLYHRRENRLRLRKYHQAK